jgi:hypothetical protein
LQTVEEKEEDLEDTTIRELSDSAIMRKPSHDEYGLNEPYEERKSEDESHESKHGESHDMNEE